VVIKGKVTDNEDNILAADIVWENLETTRKVGRLSSDPQTGDFIIVLPVGRNYGYYAEKEGYYPVSNNIDLRKSDTNMTVVENITMFEIDKIENEIVRINNLFFNFDDTRILPESIPELQRLEKLLKDHENFRIEISGHTCNKGPAEYNLDLSKRRAKAVKQYLIKNGIDAGRIRVKGYGQTKPIETNNTPEGRSENRRVEFRIFKTSEN
jgi:outer membrane protein OmpA-like peptidoglycan-associated protein